MTLLEELRAEGDQLIRSGPSEDAPEPVCLPDLDREMFESHMRRSGCTRGPSSGGTWNQEMMEQKKKDLEHRRRRIAEGINSGEFEGLSSVDIAAHVAKQYGISKDTAKKDLVQIRKAGLLS